MPEIGIPLMLGYENGVSSVILKLFTGFPFNVIFAVEIVLEEIRSHGSTFNIRAILP